MIKIKDNVYWVGIKDWELKKFHGEEFSTHRGSTYNSYLIKDKKTALVDTVWTPFHREFIDNLEKHIDLKSIDLIVINHTEPDHCGSLPYLMEKIPGTPIYCSRNAATSIKRHFHQEWNLNIVKTGDSIDLGDNKLVFVEMTMLHWPDSMAAFVAGANVLLSNDAFGMHYASPYMFNDEVDQCELFQEAEKYYANILTPFSKLVKAKIKEITALNLPIEIIAPSHGIIWRDNPLQIVEKYDQWSGDYQEGQVVVIYESMWGATKKMALAIARGVERKGLGVKALSMAKYDKSDLMTEIFKSRGVIAGCSTVNNGVQGDTAAVLDLIKGLKFKNKIGAAFGSYGWSGESAKIIETRLREAGFEIVSEGIRAQFNPSPDEIKACEAFGEAFAEKV